MKKAGPECMALKF